MNGRLTPVAEIVGKLAPEGTLSGKLSPQGGLKATLTGEGSLSAVLTPEGGLTAELGTPNYTGSYSVQPGETLHTAGRMMSQDVTGAEIQQGSVSVPDLTVSVTPSLEVANNGMVFATVSGQGTAEALVNPGLITQGASGLVTVSGANTLQLPTLEAQTLEAGGSIDPGVYLTGKQTILPWFFMGTGATKIRDFYDEETALADTLFASWTPSTTAKAIVAAKNVGTFSADMVNHEYILKWIFEFNAVYNSGATLKVIPKKQVIEIYTAIFRRSSNMANLRTGTMNGNATATLYTAPIIEYYNSSGGDALAFTGSYGIYASATAPTFSSSTANAPTVTMKTPAINARCSTTYMATARAKELDQAESKFRVRGELWQTNTEGVLRSIYEDAIVVFNE